jgi:1-acyl-sn-glycerol-3-phosphate acyltransferase
MLKRFYYLCAYWLSWFFFGAVGLGLNAVCAVLLLAPGRERRAPAVREAIRRAFASWVAWLGTARLITVTWSGLENAALPHPAVYVANHPGLVDATLVLGRLPDAICIFKRTLSHNPFLAPAAIMAGYVSVDAGVDLVRNLAQKVAAGSNLLIFPEGTRTDEGAVLNTLKPGFAIIARRAGAPVQILVIRSDRGLLPRGRPWWHVPRFPVRIDIGVDLLLPPDPDRSVQDTVRKVEQVFAERLGRPT